MSLKRWIIIISTIILSFVICFAVAYAYLSNRLSANSVPIVTAEESAFESELEEMPAELELISEEEFLESVDVEISQETDEEFREAIEAEYRLASGQDASKAEEGDESEGEEGNDGVEKDGDGEGEKEAGVEAEAAEEADEIFERVEITDRIYNILLIGDDARINEPRARSDTLILISFNRDKRTIHLTSFMRDMFVPTNMSGGSWNRINSIYRSGGPGRVINVLNYLFSMDTQRYAIVRFASVFALVDQLNGLEINLNAAEARVINRIFPEYGTVSEGPNLLNGRQVLAYARMRNVDAYGDINRTMRQRYVLKVALDKVLESKNINDIIALAGFALDNVETNVPLDEIITIGYELFSGARPAVEEIRLPVDNSYRFARYNGASVIPFDFRKNITALHEFIYGSAAGVRVPSFKMPSMDAPTTQSTGDEAGEDGESGEGAAEAGMEGGKSGTGAGEEGAGEEGGGEPLAGGAGAGGVEGTGGGVEGADGGQAGTEGDPGGQPAGGAGSEPAPPETTSEASKTRPESRYTTTTTVTTTRERWTPDGTSAPRTRAREATSPAAEPTTRARRTTAAVPAG